MFEKRCSAAISQAAALDKGVPLSVQGADKQEVVGLVERSKAGGREAQERLIPLFAAAVYRLAFRILGDRELAEDARQETFIRMLQSISSLENPRRFSTWLLSIATHVALDIARHRSNGQAEPRGPGTNEDEPLDALIRKEDCGRMEAALRNLPPQTCALLALRFQEDLSPAQISRILDLTPNQVRVDLWRARLALRRLLGHHPESRAENGIPISAQVLRERIET